MEKKILIVGRGHLRNININGVTITDVTPERLDFMYFENPKKIQKELSQQGWKNRTKNKR